MNLDKTHKQALLALLLSSSDTSSDDDAHLSDLLTIVEQELRQQRRKFSLTSQRKKRRLQQPKRTDVQPTNSDAASSVKRVPTVISVDCCESKVSTSLNGIKDEILIAYLENWHSINDEEFHRLFRIHKNSFVNILQCLEYFQQKNDTVLEIIKQTKRSKLLLIFLLYAGHQISIKTLSSKIKIYRNTLTMYIDYSIDYLLSLSATKVHLPHSAIEKVANANEFYSIAGLKNVIGCIEKLHFRFANSHDSSLNKNTNIFSLQVACDARCRFLAHDTETIDSTLAQVCEHNYCFLASQKFSLREWTIIPCESNDNKTQLHADQQLFNEKFLATFAVLQKAVSQLQRRFRQLLCIDAHRLIFARRFLQACFGLHNFLIGCNDYWLKDESLEGEQWQPLVVDAMVGTKIKSELDRFSCPRGLEKREHMIYEACILGVVEEQEIIVE